MTQPQTIKENSVMTQNPRINRSRPMQNIRQQQGWTFWSLTFVLGVVVFFSYCIFQLIPIYSANGNVVNAMELSVQELDLRRVSRREIIRKIDNQLYLDGSHKLLNYKDDIIIKRDKNTLTVQADYERLVPLFFNLGIKVDFTPMVECELGGQCVTKQNIFKN